MNLQLIFSRELSPIGRRLLLLIGRELESLFVVLEFGWCTSGEWLNRATFQWNSTEFKLKSHAIPRRYESPFRHCFAHSLTQ